MLAIGELITDLLPKTPSRTAPMQFVARLPSGRLCAAAAGAPHNALLAGLLAGLMGAAPGSLGGARFRVWRAAAIGRDWLATLIEDGIAIGRAVSIAAGARVSAAVRPAGGDG